MKRSLYLLIAIIGLQSCSPKLKPYSGEVNFLYKEAQGTIGVKSTGYGKNQKDAVQDAEVNAFKILLFRGIPSTELNIPLLENENEANIKHKDYLNRFFEGGLYKTFMMSTTISSNLIKLKGTKKISVDVKINYNSLRNDLEQNLLIRKFGF